jgi:C4-dicarboxylate transporter DctM subunit
MIVGFFIYKELTFKELFAVTKRSIVTSAMIMLVISASKVFSWYLTYEQIPSTVAGNLIEYAANPFIFLILVNIILLIVGMFMDSSAAVLILVPLFLPVVLEMGIDPIHFGVIMIINLAIGMLTPPFGLNLFVASGISKLSLAGVTRGTMPFIFVLIAALMVITYVPQLSLYLANFVYQ